MIPRYSLPEMAALFTDEARFQTWLDVEILAVEAWATIGVIPEVDAKELRERAPLVDADFVTEVQEREAVTDHDVAAFVDVVDATADTAPPCNTQSDPKNCGACDHDCNGGACTAPIYHCGRNAGVMRPRANQALGSARRNRRRR